MSHPSWVCGLKQFRINLNKKRKQSHPSWVCGLKHLSSNLFRYSNVTPFVGVWIETQRYQTNSLCTLSHTLRGCVD